MFKEKKKLLYYSFSYEQNTISEKHTWHVMNRCHRFSEVAGDKIIIIVVRHMSVRVKIK